MFMAVLVRQCAGHFAVVEECGHRVFVEKRSAKALNHRLQNLIGRRLISQFAFESFVED